MGRRPTSVTVISVILLVLGIVGIIGIGFNVLNMLVDLGPPNGLNAKLRADPGYVRYILITSAIGLCVGLLAIASSIGSLQLRPWGRKGMILYSWISIAQVVVGTILNFTYVTPKMAAAIEPSNPLYPYFGTYMLCVSGFAIPLGLTLPIIILIYFNRKKVVDAFNGIFPATGTDFPVETPAAPLPPGPPSPFP